MGLRKGTAVQSKPEAVKETVDGIDTSIKDDEPAPPAPEPAQAQAAAPAQEDPPPPADDVDADVTTTERAAQEEAIARSQVAQASPQAGTAMTAAQTQAMATAVQTGNMKQQLAAQGFEGLNFGFGSFPIITLQNTGRFESSEGGDMGTEFTCILLGSKEKWIFKNDAKGAAEDFCYSYDGVYATSGELVDDIIKGWEANGFKHEKKPYLDVQATLVTDDEDDGALVLLSIPKTSINRFSGYVAMLAARGLEAKEVVTKISLGDKVTKVPHPFHPWKFQQN